MSARKSIAQLAAVMERSRAKTLQARERKDKKREARKRGDVPSFSLCVQAPDECGQTRPAVINSTTVSEWFKAGLKRLYGDDYEPSKGKTWWTIAERALAQRMLKQYGPEVVEKAVAWFCDNWKQMVEEGRGRLRGTPNIRLMWGMRDWVIAPYVAGEIPTVGRAPEPEKKKPPHKRHNAGEWDDEEDFVEGGGWGT